MPNQITSFHMESAEKRKSADTQIRPEIIIQKEETAK
jgi:hypothetical protein